MLAGGLEPSWYEQDWLDGRLSGLAGGVGSRGLDWLPNPDVKVNLRPNTRVIFGPVHSMQHHVKASKKLRSATLGYEPLHDGLALCGACLG